MSIYYVGIGGDDGATGLTWALRKATLNGAENIPVAAGDTVYVGPGTYRELLTIDVNGGAGTPITYIGDYLGTHTDGVGGVVRVTGSDDDKTVTRANTISATTKTYRTFEGFLFDTTTANNLQLVTGCTNWIIDKCIFLANGLSLSINISGLAQAAMAVTNCAFMATQGYGVSYTHSAVVDNAGHTVNNCLFIGTGRGVNSVRVGGVVIKNCSFYSIGNSGVRVETAVTAGQTVTVTNSIFEGCTTALNGTAAGEIVENYNTFYGNGTDRTNTNTGANSVVYPSLPDVRWFFQMIYGGANPSTKQLCSPFDLASYSQLVNLAGTSPTSTDLRGTGTLGAQREWGALEYDSTLDIQAKRGSFVDGGFIGGE